MNSRGRCLPLPPVGTEGDFLGAPHALCLLVGIGEDGTSSFLLFVPPPSCPACGVSPSSLGPGGGAGGVRAPAVPVGGAAVGPPAASRHLPGARGQRCEAVSRPRQSGLSGSGRLWQPSIYFLNLISYKTVRDFLLQMSESGPITPWGDSRPGAVGPDADGRGCPRPGPRGAGLSSQPRGAGTWTRCLWCSQLPRPGACVPAGAVAVGVPGAVSCGPGIGQHPRWRSCRARSPGTSGQGHLGHRRL